jgi:peptide/nickel transport system substrate-binding protein
MLFEGLVRYENKTQIVPLLATGWTNPDDSTWVFTLKKGVKFHTGREMTATDVKASFEAAKNSDSGELYASTIESITVDSPYQVTIKTDAPDATLLKKLVSYFVYDTTSGKAADPINGTGAFVVKPGTTPTADSLELVAFDQYHGGHVYVRSFSFISDKDVKQAKGTPYAEKRADIISFSARAAEIPNTRTYNKEEVEALGVFHLPLNHLRKGPLQNLKVRQALVLAVDPDAVSKVRGQQGERASQLVPRSVPGFDSTVETPKRDVAKAKALLTEAGYPNGISIMLTYYAPSKSTAEELAKEFKEAGITLVLDPQTEIKNLGAKAQGGKTDMYFLTSATDILDASDVLSQYADSANYKNQEVIDLLGLAQKTLDPAKRLGYLKQASHKMAVDVATVPVFSPISTSIIYDPSYVIQRDIANGSNGIYFWKVYAK